MTATTQWFRMRISSLLLVPLTIWLLLAGVCMSSADYTTATAFMGQWYNIVLAVVFALVVAWHIQSGVSEVIEDYVPSHGLAVFLIGLTRGACLAGIVVIAWALYQISTGGAA